MNEKGFLLAVLEDPADPLPRQALADFLIENGRQEDADLLRLRGDWWVWRRRQQLEWDAHPSDSVFFPLPDIPPCSLCGEESDCILYGSSYGWMCYRCMF